MASALIVIASASCIDVPTEAQVKVPGVARFYADSNPMACADWNCRSLESWEYAEMDELLSRARANALSGGDLDCFDLFERGRSKLSANKVYVARQQPSFAPTGTIAGYNQNAPNEVYIMETRWASAPAAMNSMDHEMEHERLGPRPPTRGYDSWEQDIQGVANTCQYWAEI